MPENPTYLILLGPPMSGKGTQAARLAADFEDDLEALVNEEATLSEGFKEKASVIFEAALKSKLSEEVDRLEEGVVAERIRLRAQPPTHLLGPRGAFGRFGR